jgi:hypothetical protein
MSLRLKNNSDIFCPFIDRGVVVAFSIKKRIKKQSKIIFKLGFVNSAKRQ